MRLEHEYKRSKVWRGVFAWNGERKKTSLGVKIPCDPDAIPVGLEKEYRDSEVKALYRLEVLCEDLKGVADVTIYRRLLKSHKLKWGVLKEKGDKKPIVKLKDLVEFWDRLPDPRKPRQHANIKGYLGKMVKFMGEKYPEIVFCDELDKAHGKGFADWLGELGVSGETRKKIISGVKTELNRLGDDLGLERDPLRKVKVNGDDTVNHNPFTKEQVEAIFELGKEDDFVGPLAIIGVATGLRLGDAACLEWSSIDLDRGVINLNCRKEGNPVWIPIFDFFGEFLRSQARDSQYVLPEQARTYLNSKPVGGRVSELVTRFFVKLEEKLKWTPHSFERTVARKKGVRKAVVYGYGSLRTTWVTRARSAGIPIEIVQEVMGHMSTAMIKKFYDRPGEKERIDLVKQAFAPMLGEERAGSVNKPLGSAFLEKLQKLLKLQNQENWEQVRDLLLDEIAAERS